MNRQQQTLCVVLEEDDWTLCIQLLCRRCACRCLLLHRAVSYIDNREPAQCVPCVLVRHSLPSLLAAPWDKWRSWEQ